MNRRRFLGVVTCAGSGLSAGCLSSGKRYGTLQRFMLHNIPGGDPVTAEVRIELDDTDEVVHEDSYELAEGFDEVLIDCVWPDEPLRVMTRRADSDEWSTLSTADYEECLLVLSEIQENGTGFLKSEEECPVRSPMCHTNVEK